MINCLQRTLLGKSQHTQLRLQIGYVRTLLGKSQEYLILNTDVPLSNWGPIHCSAAIHFVEILSKSAISPRSNPLSCRLPAYFHRIPLLPRLRIPAKNFWWKEFKKNINERIRDLPLIVVQISFVFFMANSQCNVRSVKTTGENRWRFGNVGENKSGWSATAL